MNLHWTDDADTTTEPWIALFGGARLIRRSQGRIEIRGGTGPEQTEAREWAERFLGREPSPLLPR